MLEKNPGDVEEKSWRCWREILVMWQDQSWRIAGQWEPWLGTCWLERYSFYLCIFTIGHSTKSIAICPMIYLMDTCETAGIKFIPFFLFPFLLPAIVIPLTKSKHRSLDFKLLENIFPGHIHRNLSWWALGSGSLIGILLNWEHSLSHFSFSLSLRY